MAELGGRVLEGISAKLGDVQTRRLIMEYRAKQALLDMKKWSNAFRSLLNDHFGASIGPEWSPYWINCDAWKATPYAKTTNDGSGLLTPEQRTTPGWSGANQIPLTVSGAVAAVDFQPIGANMSCQLCYRATDGVPVYGEPVSSGPCSLRLDKAPGKGVVIAVICNTDYKYMGDTTRKAHYDYRLKLGAGVTGAADNNTKWYNVTLPVASTVPRPIGPSPVRRDIIWTESVDGRSMGIGYVQRTACVASIGIFTPSGALVKTRSTGYQQPGRYSKRIIDEGAVAKGLYVIKLVINEGTFFTKTAVVK